VRLPISFRLSCHHPPRVRPDSRLGLQINWQDRSYIALLVAIADRRRSGVVRVATVAVITVPVAMTTAVVAVMVINAAVLILRRLSRTTGALALIDVGIEGEPKIVGKFDHGEAARLGA